MPESVSSQEASRPAISWGHVTPSRMIEARISASIRRIRDIDPRVLCLVTLEELHEFGRRAVTYSAEVTLGLPAGNTIVARHEAPPGHRSQRLAHAIALAFLGARRQLLEARATLVPLRSDVGHGPRKTND